MAKLKIDASSMFLRQQGRTETLDRYGCMCDVYMGNSTMQSACRKSLIFGRQIIPQQRQESWGLPRRCVDVAHAFSLIHSCQWVVSNRLTPQVAKEWGPFNIRCNAVTYGFIATRLTAVSHRAVYCWPGGHLLAY